MKQHTIIYSHGFGVRKDGRGLFTDIADSMPQVKHVMFNYNQFDSQTNSMTAAPLHEQAKILEQQLSKVSNEMVDIVAHSQGCLVAALAKPKNVRRIICLTPPDSVDIGRMVEFFGNRAVSVINLDGNSQISRRDGSTTIIPASYWQNLRGLDVMDIYKQMAKLAKTTFIVANQDEVLGKTNFSEIDKLINPIRLNGNHDFTGDARQPMISQIQNVILADN